MVGCRSMSNQATMSTVHSQRHKRQSQVKERNGDRFGGSTMFGRGDRGHIKVLTAKSFGQPTRHCSAAAQVLPVTLHKWMCHLSFPLIWRKYKNPKKWYPFACLSNLVSTVSEPKKIYSWLLQTLVQRWTERWPFIGPSFYSGLPKFQQDSILEAIL